IACMRCCKAILLDQFLRMPPKMPPSLYVWQVSDRPTPATRPFDWTATKRPVTNGGSNTARSTAAKTAYQRLIHDRASADCAGCGLSMSLQDSGMPANRSLRPALPRCHRDSSAEKAKLRDPGDRSGTEKDSNDSTQALPYGVFRFHRFR